MLGHNLLTNAKFIALNATVAAGVDGAITAVTNEIDTQGYDGCLIAFKLGAIAANGVINTRVKNSSTSATYGAGTIDRVGSDKANDADTDDNKWIIHDIRKPLRRYLQAYYQRTVGNVTIESVFAILYNPINGPVTQTEVEASQVLAGPTPSSS